MNEIKVGRHFKDGLTTFEVIRPDTEKKGVWRVRRHMPSAVNCQPKVIEMSAEKIIDIIEGGIADNVALGIKGHSNSRLKRLPASNGTKRLYPAAHDVMMAATGMSA